MMERIRQMREQEGFTLIELLIVIVILGVLAAVVVFAVNGITDRGKASACKSDVKSVEVASEAYYAKNGGWATAIDDAGHTSTTLVGGGFLHSAPGSGNGYTIAYTAGTGAVASTPANCAL
jgi:prepilin-type N-terminal cleavage/methylation domain-containing protein